MIRVHAQFLVVAMSLCGLRAALAEEKHTIDLNINLNIKNSGEPLGGCPCGRDHGKKPEGADSAAGLPPVGGWTPDKIVKFYTEAKDRKGSPKYLVEVPYGPDKKKVRQYYAIEGDVLVTIDELTRASEDLSQALAYQYKLRELEQETKALAKSNSYVGRSVRMQEAYKPTSELFTHVDGLRKHQLVLNLVEGRDDVWYHPAGSSTRRDFATRPLTYCIRVDDFSTAEFEKLEKDLRIVTKGQGSLEGWENICNVKFEYKPNFNSAPDKPNGAPPDGIDFTVRSTTTTSFVAAAFFPGEADFRHHVLVGPSFFTIDSRDISSTGVMRHELGHALGFRHEHIRVEAPADCPVEELTGTRTLGPYDMYSVMHYLCGDAGTTHLNFSASDKLWASQVYPKSTSATTTPTSPDLILPYMLNR